MRRKILLPTDFSENSWNAIKYAIKFFGAETCNFYILHVNRFDNFMTDSSPYIFEEDTISDVYTLTGKLELRKLIKRITKQLTPNEKHKFYTISDYGFFIESIRNHVEDKKIDLKYPFYYLTLIFIDDSQIG